jgi:S-DNA-T family DNA segregation ATPase FtsK/SpoIIIE
LRRVFLGSRDLTQTAAQHRRDRAEEKSQEKTFAFETEAAPTDVMSSYPEEDDVEPTVALVDEPEGAVAEEPVTQDFDAELAAIEAEEEKATEVETEVVPEQVELTPQGKKRGVTISEGISYKAPPASALEQGKGDKGIDPRDQEAVGRKLVESLGHFGVEAKIVGIVSGPHVSRYELRLAPGTKVKKVTELANDLAYALASTDIRILAPIPGKQAVGVEVPNARRRMVRLGDIYSGRPEKTSPLVAWLGKGIDGNAVWTDLAKMPHVLVAGTTGSGKSGCVNAILSSILMQASPNDVRLVLVDPKQVELNHYENVPHLLTPVVTSPRLAANVLANLIGEMESRYGIMSQARCRNLAELNRVRAKAGEAPLPHILCVIDELADLMMVSPAEVEDSIIRLAQKSRATGIHLVLATQRPSTDIITGTIKVNIPSRIAFAVSSQTDSRVILDQGGAEALLGQGDMLFRGAGTSKLQRIQGAFVSEDEIARITGFWAKQGEPEFEAELLETVEEKAVESEGDFDPDSDDLLDEAIRVVVETETASVSMIQRRLRVGYTRAGRLIDMLERRGIISGYEGSKPRQVLVAQADLARLIGGGGETGPAEPEPSSAVSE